MLSLNYINNDLSKAKKEHLEFFSCYVTKKLFGHKCQKDSTDLTHPERTEFCSGNKIRNYTNKYKENQFFKNFIKQNLDQILIGSPDTLDKINGEFTELVDNHFGIGTYNDYHEISLEKRPSDSIPFVHNFFEDVNSIFNYDRLSKENLYSSYILTENLGVRTCVYCNRTYAITHRKKSGGRLMNPQLDHWFPQSKFPLLQISFQNLIPCCDVCNSRVKNNEIFTLKDNFHPYQKDEENVYFNYRLLFGGKYKIYFTSKSNNKIKRTCEALHIDEMYEAHAYELHDLIVVRKKYTNTYLNILKSTFPEANLSDNEIYRLAFGTELDKKDFHKRPFSKFKHDILQDLGIIKI